MLKQIILAVILLYSGIYADDSVFMKFFTDAALRIDYHHIGDAQSEFFTVDKMYRYDTWGRSKNNLLDNFNNGRYYFKVHDAESGELLYSKGFDSYFGEYQTSKPAIEGIKKTFHETAIIPFPQKPVRFTIEKRNPQQELTEIYSTVVDPSDVMIINKKNKDNDITIYESYKSGYSSERVDIAILGEGYSGNDKSKFKKDIDKFTAIFFEQEPYLSMRNMFNIYGILKPSDESGVDEPRANIFRETSMNATFNSMGSERYLLTEDNKTMRDIAGYVPYDAIYIMVNHDRYGGGGIYNLFCTFTSDAQFSKYLFIHEFGHSFAGLADEYYTSPTSYTELHKPTVEPTEPNITALLDPGNIKWRYLLSEEIKIPTPWEKEAFDKMDVEWQKERIVLNNKIAELKKNKASERDIINAEKTYALKDKEHSNKVDVYLRSSMFWDKVGAFEGAGYSFTGLYRPMIDCIMFSKGDKPFCNVCGDAIVKVIKHYSE